MSNDNAPGFADFVPRWIFISLFLLVLWFFNDRLTYSENVGAILLFLLGNLLLIAVYIWVIVYFFIDYFQSLSGVTGWAVGLKFLLASWLFITIQQTLKITKSVATLKAENLALKSEKYKAEFDQLRKQVNPHFLFNSLSTLRTMIRSNNAKSEDFVLNLSDVYRQILQKRENNTVTLKEEMEFLNAYIYLLKVRHEEAFNIDIEIMPQAQAYNIPVYALQLLIENCIKHNIVSASRPLYIRVYQPEETSITVVNNYQPKTVQEESLGVGLNNLRHRYKLLGLDEGVSIKQTEKEYEVTLNLY